VLKAETPLHDETGTPSTRGFVLGIAGAAVYLVGTCLPGVSGDFGGVSSSAVALSLGWGAAGSARYRVAGFVLLFGTMLVVAAVSLVGLRSPRRARWAAALAGASTIWFVPTLSRVLGWFYPHFRPTDWIGTWAMYAGTAIAFIGGVVAVVELRTTNDEAGTTSSGVVGFILGVLGVVVYGVSTTLPYYSSTLPGLPPGAAVSFSLFSELKRQSVVLTIASAILVYGVPAVLAVISFGGIRGRCAGLWAMALLAGALAWSPRLALLVDYSRYSRGFWGVEVSIVVLLAAGTLAVIGTRAPSTSSTGGDRYVPEPN